MTDERPVVMLDLNGVVHRYARGWVNEAPLYDPPTEGFKDWVKSLKGRVRLVIWPTHMNTPREMLRIRTWLRKHQLLGLGLELVPHPPRGLKCKIDDRALHFSGNWADFPAERLLGFRTWSGR